MSETQTPTWPATIEPWQHDALAKLASTTSVELKVKVDDLRAALRSEIEDVLADAGAALHDAAYTHGFCDGRWDGEGLYDPEELKRGIDDIARLESYYDGLKDDFVSKVVADLLAEPKPDETLCEACNVALVPGDPVYDDASGGTLHANCCGPERESYTLGGESLGADDPIPEPDIWTLDGNEPPILTRDQFLIVVAHRLIHRAALDHDQAADHAKSILDGYLDTEQVEFGAQRDDLSWDAAAARDLADEELSCWEG